MSGPRCPSCDADLADAELGWLPVEERELGTQVQHLGLVVCPDCGVAIGGASSHDRTDLDEMDAETWERVRSYNDI